jgi:carbonic anhydrase/acetyltransferase-like protein (isoleucine patch superfamily)
MIYALDEHEPQLGEGAWIAPDAHVIGRVTLGALASIWFGATLRGDNEPIEIGAGANLQERCMVHTDMGFPVTVGRDCTVGHHAILHGCTVEDESLIGMGAIVLNGAVIGRGSLVGAGALVTEGKAIPPGSLVLGSPGKVVRSLDEDALAGLRASAEHYRANAARFRAGLREVRG